LISKLRGLICNLAKDITCAFKERNKDMTSKQRDWAKSHDWYEGFMHDTGGRGYIVFVKERTEDKFGNKDSRIVSFVTFEALLKWAGD
jgi:hypothetical protein